MRVMRVLTRNNLGGPATQAAAALWAEHRRRGIPTLLVVGEPEGETPFDLTAAGVPAVDAAAPAAADEGWIRLDTLRRAPSPLRDRRAMRTLRQWIEVWRPDVVHTHTSKAGVVGRRAAFGAPRRPRTVHTFHGHVLRDYFSPPVSALLARMERRLARGTDALVAVSPSCAQELAALRVAPLDRFAIVPPAVPEAAVRARDEVRRERGWSGFVVGCIGRLVPIKRTERFLDAMRGLEGVRGVVFGDGPERARLHRVCPGHVDLCGADPAVSSLIAGMDALVLPGRREGLPLVAVEAFRAGVPVIGFDVPGVVDALRTWGRGIVVPDADGSRGLRTAIADLASGATPEGCWRPTSDELARFEVSRVAATLAGLYERITGAVSSRQRDHGQ